MPDDGSIPSMPLLGDAFPEMTVKTTHAMKNLPGDYAGKWFVLFSHPGDFTPVCTTEFNAFSKHNDDFKALNAELIGVSVDQVCVKRVWFTTDGCGPSLACGSMATTLCRGRQVGEAMQIAQADILRAPGGMPVGSAHCALLAADTLRAACESADTESVRVAADVARRRTP